MKSIEDEEAYVMVAALEAFKQAMQVYMGAANGKRTKIYADVVQHIIMPSALWGICMAAAVVTVSDILLEYVMHIDMISDRLGQTYLNVWLMSFALWCLSKTWQMRSEVASLIVITSMCDIAFKDVRLACLLMLATTHEEHQALKRIYAIRPKYVRIISQALQIIEEQKLDGKMDT